MALVKSKPAEREQSQDTPSKTAAELIEQLAAPSSEQRRWAARDLVDFPEHAQDLLQRLPVETDRSVREVLLSSLTRIGDPVAIAGMVECLRSEDAALRNEVVEVMKLMPDEVAPIMKKLLLDSDPDVRIFAVNVLESLRHPEVENWLIDVIAQDPHVNVCATAVDLLGEVGSVSATEPLTQLKARFSDEPYIQFAADLALRRIHES